MRTFLCFIVGLAFMQVEAQFFAEGKNIQSFNGFFNFHFDEDEGKIFLEIPKNKLEYEFLYVHALRSGLGSNDIGLDRGQLGSGDVVKFYKSGNKILLIQPNQNFRAVTDNNPERRSIEEAFARSVLFGFEIKKTIGDTYLVDLTPFLMEDAHNVALKLKSEKQGTYKLNTTRSAVWMERTKAFPKNVEFEAMLTFVGEPTGRELKSVAPNAQSISTIQHHSFVELPDDQYTPREFDPRSGSFPMEFMDYATPVESAITKRFIYRHRLEKLNPGINVSEAKEPIIYYLDPGTPEPVRTALLEGARWWNQAFEAIGYKDAFQVEMLPDDADPLDVRYNVIQWVHRSTRGWSYGSMIADPRTGEIIKGHVSLGSLRIRQDFLIAQALMNKPFALSNENTQPMLNMALARIRQLSAHEVGHTLGFAHNFAASTNNRASVMDYPHPKLTVVNDQIDFSDAYATGIGEWDKVTVAYSYSDIPNGGDEATYLKAILEGAFANGLRYMSDADARPQGGAHAKAHLWDNGGDAAEELLHLLEVRSWAINNFSEDNIRSGEPYSVLEDVFVPLYLLHRYQTEATVKLIGGMDYDFKIKNYAGVSPSYVTSNQQHNSLTAIMNTLNVQTLKIPADKLKLFPPRAMGYERTRESFKSETGVAFDPLGIAATASEMTISLLLHPERVNRLIQQKALEPNNLGLEEVLDALIDKNFEQVSGSPYDQELLNTLQATTLTALMKMALNKKVLPQARGMAHEAIETFGKELKGEKTAFSEELLRMIDVFHDDPDEFEPIEVSKIPDGSPIGSFECDFTNPNE